MNPIKEHQWEKRVLIFSATSPTNIGYKRQEQLMSKGKKGMKERDLIVYKLYDDHWIDHKDKILSKEQAVAIRKEYDIPEGQFMVLLIGKDGGVKMRKDDIMSTREIFALIDSMPMRKQEMREQKRIKDNGLEF
ncbi:DUF4174 domain-containing protein [Ekhidna sp.]|uniref:DUF4174 domain-containing protein n=1 Tax=Ekhidna sp. TaxID=2608089 RepID=UPI003CCB8FCD